MYIFLKIIQIKKININKRRERCKIKYTSTACIPVEQTGDNTGLGSCRDTPILDTFCILNLCI